MACGLRGSRISLFRFVIAVVRQRGAPTASKDSTSLSVAFALSKPIAATGASVGAAADSGIAAGLRAPHAARIGYQRVTLKSTQVACELA